MKDRFFAFFGENRAAVAMDVDSENVTVALALCNYRDDFSKFTARNILNGRIDASKERPVRLVFNRKYDGDRPKRDIMIPIMKTLRSLPKNRDYSSVKNALKQIVSLFPENTRGET